MVTITSLLFKFKANKTILEETPQMQWNKLFSFRQSHQESQQSDEPDQQWAQMQEEISTMSRGAGNHHGMTGFYWRLT